MSKKYTTKIKINYGKSKLGASDKVATGTHRTEGLNSKKTNYKTFGGWSSMQSNNSSQSKGSSKSGATGTKRTPPSNFAHYSVLGTRLKKFGGLKGINKKKFAKFIYTGFAIFLVFTFIGSLVVLARLQELTKGLPDPERPFDNEKFKAQASVIYDRKGTELYRLFGDQNRDIVSMTDNQTIDDVVPTELKWSVLAAEDIDFYQHPGFDVTGIARCGLRYITTHQASCGGSTITQQVVKLAALEDNTRSLERKLQELVLSVQLENKVNNKDKILLLYMNIANQGGNIYGVKTAAKYYFNKSLDQLTLEEAVTLAAIPNNPAYLSPTRSINPEVGKELLESRRQFIYDQLLKYKDKINGDVRASREKKAKAENRELTDAEKEDFITQAKIDAARVAEVKYQSPKDQIKAPHFVFFARDQLTKRGYNNGEPFTLDQINKGGYKITTTLDYEMQEVALDVVQNVAVNQYGAKNGSKNAAMMSMQPGTGQILVMVGSKCYDDNELANCSQLGKDQGKLFDPQVNILTTQQQPGSSIKPFVYYLAFREGRLSPGSQIADIPIQIGNYKPKNSDPNFIGINSVRQQLSRSRNIPAVTTLVGEGPEKLAQLKSTLGYTINVDPTTYGPSAALGAQDVYGYEHANAFATLANGGSYVPYEAILKIEDKDGNVIWDAAGKNKPTPQKILDERAVYLINDATDPKSITGADSPVKWNDNRHMSGKTGTSENNRDNWFVNYSPDFVTLGWAGNNDNTPMKSGSFGSTNAEPWVREFMKREGNSEYFKARTPYARPGGISSGQICGKIKIGGDKGKEYDVCEGGNDMYISDLKPPVYFTKQNVEVCVDQPDRLARDIDKQTGNSVEKEFYIGKEFADSLQKYLDDYLKEKYGAATVPTDLCDVSRSPNGTKPWAVINSPTEGANVTDKITANITAYSPTGNVVKMDIYLGSTLLKTVNANSFVGDLDVPSGTVTGSYKFRVVVTNNDGVTGESSVNINVNKDPASVTIVAPTAGNKPAGTININATFTGSLSGFEVCITHPSNGQTCFDEAHGAIVSGNTVSYLNYDDSEKGTYKIIVKSTIPTTVTSPEVTIKAV
jgi:penicillin-binding protein 1A